jgi:parallel beta-helix repeat protein
MKKDFPQVILGVFVLSLIIAAGRIQTAVDAGQIMTGPKATSDNKIFWVPDNYTTIQDAINHRYLESIIVRPGIYEKINLTPDRATNLFLKGENPETTIIDGNGTGPVVLVNADNATITGFCIRNSGRNSGNDIGVDVANTKCNITGNTISANGIGIRLGSNDNVLACNNVSNNAVGGIMMAYTSGHNTISGNNITNNRGWGIDLSSSHNNTVYDNCIAGNDYGIYLSESNSSTFFHNNFINNTSYQVYDASWSYGGYPPSKNSWNETYPWGGNYWSDYDGNDNSWSEYQNVTGSDMMGDQPYIIDKNNQDNYALLTQWPWSNVFRPYLLALTGSNVTDFAFNRTLHQLSFNVDSDSSNSCSVIIPRYVMDGSLNVFIDDAPTAYFVQWSSDCHMINFSYVKGSHSLKITGEIVDRPPISTFPDVNSDGKVDIVDVTIVAKAFKTHWNSPIP